MSGNGQFIFSDTGGESANIRIASTASILSGARITLRAPYTPFKGEMLVEEANGYLDRFILGSSYSGFKLEYSDENDEYKGYILKSLPPLPSGGGPDYPSRALTDLPTGITVSGNIDGGAALTITELRSGSSAALDAMR